MQLQMLEHTSTREIIIIIKLLQGTAPKPKNKQKKTCKRPKHERPNSMLNTHKANLLFHAEHRQRDQTHTIYTCSDDTFALAGGTDAYPCVTTTGCVVT
jgi:hypothetical protein